MAVSYSRSSDRSRKTSSFIRTRLDGRWGEMAGLLAATLVVILGLYLTWQAKTANPEKVAFDEIEKGLGSGTVHNLNRLTGPAELESVLVFLPNENERRFFARKIFDFADSRRRRIENVGALVAIRIDKSEVESVPGLESLRKRLDESRKNDAGGDGRNQGGVANSRGDDRMQLLTASQIRRLKPSLVVRTPQEFRDNTWKLIALAILVFYAIHLIWRYRGFKGDQVFLPVIHLLTGLGMILMLSLRDPLRDSLSVSEFAVGVILGAAGMLVLSLIDYRRWFSRVAILPLLAAIVLSAVLVRFGSGPGASDARVNLFGTQPVEFIKILVVFFLAGYLAENWEFLRELKQKGRGLLAWLGRLNAPRLVYFLPVVIAMFVVLGFFFLQKDLGPALVLGATFLALYAVTRMRAVLVAGGLSILCAGVWLGYKAATPFTVYQRLRIWIDPWDNGLRNGDQIAHGFWALAGGSITGTGLGLGDISFIPAGHTDLVLTAIGEELGFVGVGVVLALYGVLVARGLRASLRASNTYEFFLALGLILITAFQILLISAGVLGMLPLSGVVSPFISYGKSSMLANCLIFGILAAVSSGKPSEQGQKAFSVPVRRLGQVLAALVLLLIARAGYIQTFRAGDFAIAPALTRQGDDKYRYQYNPRLQEVEKKLPRGNIYDRNGIIMASSRWDDLEAARNQLQSLGVNIDAACPRRESRCYPFGGRLFHLLGDASTLANWGATNTDYIESDYAGRLRGFDDKAKYVTRTVFELDRETRQITQREVSVRLRDFSELLPLLWYRNRPGQSDARALLEKPRDIRMSIDVKLQLQVSELLKQRILQKGREKGAAVVMDPATGDLLASVSYPWPENELKTPSSVAPALEDESDADEIYLDRARWGQYPPGSTFKLVTAIAALRHDPRLVDKEYECKPLAGGRVGNIIEGWSDPVRDDESDGAHGKIRMERAIVKSCNAFFAQLGAYDVGAAALLDTAGMFNIEVADPNTSSELYKHLPKSSFGQGGVLVTPFRLAKVSATIANNGLMPFGRWVIDDSNLRPDGPKFILTGESASIIGRAMRGVVEQGTARSLRSINPSIAGKTGTAEVTGAPSHSWFTGYAPASGRKRIAFAVIVENGGYGGSLAAPLAGDIVKAANSLGLLR